MHCRGGLGGIGLSRGFTVHTEVTQNLAARGGGVGGGVVDDWTKLQCPYFEHIGLLVGVCLYVVCAYIQSIHTYIEYIQTTFFCYTTTSFSRTYFSSLSERHGLHFPKRGFGRPGVVGREGGRLVTVFVLISSIPCFSLSHTHTVWDMHDEIEQWVTFCVCPMLLLFEGGGGGES